MRSARALLLYTVALWTFASMILLTFYAINPPDTQQSDPDSPDALDIGHVKPPGQYAVTSKTILGNDYYNLFERSIIGTSTSAPTTTENLGQEAAKTGAPVMKSHDRYLFSSNANSIPNHTTLAKLHLDDATSKATVAKMKSSDEILPMLFKSSYALPIRTPPTLAKLDDD